MKKFAAHWRLRRWLSAYLDGELAEDELKDVRQHVAHCRACQRDLVEIRAGRDLFLRGEANQRFALEASQLPLSAHLPGVRWAGIAALAAGIVVVSLWFDTLKGLAGWWRPPSVHAMDINFYVAQFRRMNSCVSPCTSLTDTTLDQVRASSPFAVQYPTWLPEGMVLRRVIRYRTPRYEGVGLVFAGYGKRFCLFQQPRKLGVVISGQRTAETRICGRRSTWIDGDQVELYRWTTRGLCFVVATNLEKHEVEAVVDSLRALSE